MTGLDPVGRKEVRDLMIELKSRGKTVFFSTHILSDVESICDRVAILNLGRLLSCGNLNDLVSVETKYVDLVFHGENEALHAWCQDYGAEIIHQDEYASLRLKPKGDQKCEEHLNESLRGALAKGIKIHSVTHKKDNLEDVFMKQIGRLESRI
jgi:ABC-2 type transport system ATP-binding protein